MAKPRASRSKEDHVLPQAKLIDGEHPRYSPSARLIRDVLGSVDGSLSSLTPVDESTFKRLQPLQAQLTRNIQHFAGGAFESLPITGQDETTRQIGTERAILLRDSIALNGVWRQV